MNRLGASTSPYLLQHADNPVHWWEWSAEAFAEAKRRDVPVLISVGYAACHWCHVMAHESFEDIAVADALNEAVVSIKVDREERPDVDAVYMTATQAMTGQGGWPMTVFATPDGEPFFCGTYYPRAQFLRLIDAIMQAWRDQRDAVREQGAAVVEAVAQSQGKALPAAAGSVAPEVLDAAAKSLAEQHDPTHGGFGDAPKFPPHMAMLFLLRHHQRTGDERSLEIVRHTAEAMARGGIYDQLAGGFARYSVDERWLVPHFEKMLYDNALLLRAYTDLWRLTGDRLALRVATETAQFLTNELFESAFVSSLDADTGGHEGATYVWTQDQLRAVLGDEDGAWAADLLGVTASGTFEHGTSVLRLARDVDDEESGLATRWADVRQRLLGKRRERPQPGRDDKVIAAWNGLAITALVEFATLTGDERATEHAVAAARYLADVHVIGGRLRRASRAGVVGEPVGVLDDYGAVAEAFCAVHQLTGDGRWLELAGTLVDAACVHFVDPDGAGGFFDTADDAERLVARPSDPTDNATPAGISALAAALVTYTGLTGDATHHATAVRALETLTPIMARYPRYAGYSAAVAEAVLSGPYEIAVAGPDGPRRRELADTARRQAPPGAVVVVGEPDRAGVPLLAGRPTIGGEPAVYVCRGFVCDRPVTTPDEVRALLSR